MSYIGNSPGVASQRVETAFTATSNQTAFTPSSGYTLGYCDVYQNGVKLVNGDDYTASDGATVTLATGAASGDSIVIVASFPRGLTDGYLKSEADAKYLTIANPSYTGTLTGGTGVITIGTNQFVKDSSGNIGIGTATPGNKLQVVGSTGPVANFVGNNANNFVTISDNNNTDTITVGSISGGNAYLYSGSGKYTALYAGATERLRVDSAGNVGIGLSPSAWASSLSGTIENLSGGLYPYHPGGGVYDVGVFTNAYYDGTWRYKNTGSSSAAYFMSSNTSSSGNRHTWRVAGTGTAGSGITYTDAMVLDAGGKLGVGVSSMTYQLEVAGSIRSQSGAYILSQGTTNTGIIAPYNLIAGSGTDYGTTVFAETGRNIYFCGNGSATKMALIDTNGNLVVGTSANISSAIRGLFVRSGDCNVVAYSTSTGNDQQSYFMVMAQDGARSAAFGMYRNGSADACAYVNFAPTNNGGSSFVWSDTSGVLRIGTPGSIGTTGGTVIGTQTSDERLKTIDPEFPYGLAEVLQLNPIRYTLDGETNKRLGFGAQTTQPILPEPVYDSGECVDGYDRDPDNVMIQTPKSDRTRLMMDNVQIIPVLVKAIQEQQAIIEQLQADVATLKGTP